MMTTLFYEKPDALLQLPSNRHAVIEASAGTGKTYTIQHIVVDLLLRRKISVQDILIVTFTRAATGDLKKKIRETLQELIEVFSTVEEGEVATYQGGKSTPGAPTDTSQFGRIDAEGMSLLRRALRTFDQASIYTIHGFCQRILVEHAFANKRLLEQEHVDGESLVNRAISEALREDVPEDAELRKWLQFYLGSGKKISDLRKALRTYVTTTGEYLPEFNLAKIETSREQLGQVFSRTDLQTLGQAISDAGVSTRTRNIIIDKHLPNLLAGWQAMEGHLADALLEGMEEDAKK